MAHGPGTLVCPKCGDADSLRSDETAVIGYPIIAFAKDDGTPGMDYTGASYSIFDEGTEFRDDVWCTACDWNGGLADLAAEDPES